MNQLQKILLKGADGYTPTVMWFLSGGVSKKELTYQLEQMKKQGIHDFFIHPSAGLQEAYLGEHFFDTVKHAAAEAARLGMNYWIYDEFDWPSGTAGGQISSEPCSRSYCFCRLKEKVGAGETARICLPDKELYDTNLLAFVVDGKISRYTPDGETVCWRNDSEGEVEAEVYISRWQRRAARTLSFQNPESPVVMKDGYLNTLSKQAVEVFIEKTHERYKEHIGEDFGKQVKGFFTDEVAAMEELNETGVPKAEMPWTPELPEVFQRRKGYDLIPLLPELVNRTNPKLAVDYWEVVSEMFMEAYMDTTHGWCQENGLLYTGHAFGEESIESTVYRTGDPYEFYKRLDCPGADSICTYYRTGDMSFNIAAKKVASAARFAGKERILCETFTLGGWNIRLRDMKRIFNRLALLGVNFIQLMGARYEFKPARDCLAMTNNWQNPLFKHYEALSKYISAIQWFVTNSKLEAKTLLLYPITAARAEMPTIPFPKRDSRDRNLTMYGLINSLLHLQIPFEIGFESLVDEAQIKDGKLIIQDVECDTVILPCATYLKESTFAKLQAFANSGGRIVEVNGKPEKIIGKEVYDAPPFKNAVAYDCYEYEMEGEYVSDNDYYQQTAPGVFTAALKAALKDTASLVVSMVPCEGIMSAVRNMNGTSYVMIINDKDKAQTVSGTVLSDKPYQVYDTETGALKAIHKSGRDFSFAIMPYECVILEVSDQISTEAEEDHAAWKEWNVESVSFMPTQPNIAMPHVYHVRGEAAQSIIHAHRAGYAKRIRDLADRLSHKEMVPCRAMGNRYVPSKGSRDWFGWEPKDHLGVPPGGTAVCAYDFTLDGLPRDLILISDPQYRTGWYLNGELLYPTEFRREWHYANPIYDLKDLVKDGKNRLICVCDYPEIFDAYQLPCAMLRGDFRVFDDFVLTQKAGLNKAEYWNGLGYACYTGDGVYEITFHVPQKASVRLKIDTTDVAEIYVNDTFVTKRLWDPYEADLSPYIKSGDNKLTIRVTSTLSNFLYASNPSGINGIHLYLKKEV